MSLFAFTSLPPMLHFVTNFGYPPLPPNLVTLFLNGPLLQLSKYNKANKNLTKI